jgi:hypothetical protein
MARCHSQNQPQPGQVFDGGLISSRQLANRITEGSMNVYS